MAGYGKKQMNNLNLSEKLKKAKKKAQGGYQTSKPMGTKKSKK